MTAGPDFLCIGLQKAGTGWLFDQLQHHPDFWMPPIKEFHYFDRPFPDVKAIRTIRRAQKAPDKIQARREGIAWRALDERDFQFFALAREHEGLPADMERYKALFAFKGKALSGDITPAYSTLPDSVVAEVTEALPDVKVALLLRDPVQRLWSQVAMNHRRGKFDPEAMTDLRQFQAYIEQRSVFSRSFPTRVAAKWRAHLRPAQFAFFFFDDIVARPGELRSAIIRHLGGNPNKESGEIEPTFNRKADLPKIEMSDPIRAFLIDYFREELLACAGMFGGAALGWCDRYGLPRAA